MALCQRFALSSTGRVALAMQAVADASNASSNAGQAYVSLGGDVIGPTGAVFASVASVAASDASNGGWRRTGTGLLRVYDATAGLPANTNVNQGVAMTEDGQVCYTTANNATNYSLAGVAVDSLGRVYADLLSFVLPLADLGAGAVDTALLLGQGDPTFTRATVAWTKLSTGLWAEVASGTARSCYIGANTAVGAYGGYFAEGARTQLVTPTASIRDMTDAAWVATDITPAKDATGIDGVANSASSLTCDVDGGTILQTLTAAASSRTYSVWLRRVTGSGAITIQQGATTLAVTSSLNTATYTRVELNASVLNSAFGIIMGTAGDVIQADFNQFEAGTFASSPIASTAARNADVLTYSVANMSGSAGTCYAEASCAFTFAAGVVSFVGPNTSGRLLEAASTDNLRVIDSAANIAEKTGLSTWSGNSVRKIASSWGATGMAVTASGLTVATQGTFVSMSTAADIGIGCFAAGANQPFGTLRNVRIWTSQLPNAALQVMTDG